MESVYFSNFSWNAVGLRSCRAVNLQDIRSTFNDKFLRPPQVIVYDNAYNLHQYCLNLEPYFLKDTLFVVDSFHQRGHVGCSCSYRLDTYQHMAIKEMNSQVNEQATAA